jgi:hypothetical protein
MLIYGYYKIKLDIIKDIIKYLFNFFQLQINHVIATYFYNKLQINCFA